MSNDDSGAFTFDDIPTGRLQEPEPEELPGIVLGLTIGLRTVARRMGRREAFERKLLGVIVGASASVMVTVVSAAVYIGGELAHLESLRETAADNRARIVHIEQKLMARDRAQGDER